MNFVWLYICTVLQAFLLFFLFSINFVIHPFLSDITTLIDVKDNLPFVWVQKYIWIHHYIDLHFLSLCFYHTDWQYDAFTFVRHQYILVHIDCTLPFVYFQKHMWIHTFIILLFLLYTAQWAALSQSITL